MKDSSKTFNLTLAAFLFPVFTLGIILTGIFVVDQSAFAQESSPINSQKYETYFQDDEPTELAQSGGLLQPREDTNEGTVNTEETVEAAECSDVYIEDDLRIDFDNDEESVLKLQSFLKTYEGFDYVELTGTFGEETLRAVLSFQTRYAEDILEPWGYQPDEATGYVYITTKKKINEIHCDQQFDLSQAQQEEIREFRELLNELRAEGFSFETPNYLASYYANMNSSVPEFDDQDSEMTTDEEPTEDTNDEETDDQDVQGTSSATTSVEESDDRNFFQRLFGIGGSSDTDVTATTTATTTKEEPDESDEEEEGDDVATTSTSSDEEETDDRNFFQRLFGTGDDTDENTSTSTATSTETDEEEEEMTATSATATAATSATTSSLGDVASGVYNGVNSILNFLLSPTFLLIVLVILILLLVATIIEGSGDEDDEASDMDPWAEYDETQDIEDEDTEEEDADEIDEDENEEDEDIPTPPEDDKHDDDLFEEKRNN